MQVTWVPMIAQAICTALHAFWCHIYIEKMGKQVTGLGYAMATTNLLMFASVTVISHSVTRLKPALLMPTREAFRDWGEYFSIAVPVTVMLSAEWWAYEILNFSSGYLGVTQQAA